MNSTIRNSILSGCPLKVMTQLKIFRATVNYQPHDKFFFNAQFTPDLARRFLEKHVLASIIDLYEYFGMYRPEEIQPEEAEDFPKSDYLQN